VPQPARASSPALGIVALGLTVLMWGLSSVAIKALGTSGLVTATYRLWFAIPPLWLTTLAPGVRARLDRDWLRASLAGGLLFAVHQILYFSSLKLTTVANVTIIGALQPALVLLIAGPMFGEQATRHAIVWSGIAFVGTALVVIGAAHPNRSSLVGDGLAGLNMFAFTAYFLASKRFRERVHPWNYVIGVTTVAGIVIALVTLASRQDLGAPAPWDWVLLAAIAIFPGTLGHVLANWAHAHVSAFVASMILLAVPVIATAGAVLFVGEHVGALQLAGGMIVLTAIATIVRSARRIPGEVLAEGAAEAP